MLKYGFIGTGNMGGALASAVGKTMRERGMDTKNLLLSNRPFELAEALADRFSATACGNETAAREADCLFLGVKPQMMGDMLAEIAPILRERGDSVLLVTMAAGLTIADIRRMAGYNYPVIRIMPNTPAQIGEGMILWCAEDVDDARVSEFLTILAGAGRFANVSESKIDACCALSGSGPAFVDLFLEALADGGVACGLTRAEALTYAAQTVMGSAKLLLETGEHPGVLKDKVCSPAGTTIAGVRELEKAGFRSAVIEAVIAAYERSKALR